MRHCQRREAETNRPNLKQIPRLTALLCKFIRKREAYYENYE